MDTNVFGDNYTPGIGSIPTQSSEKLLVVIFVVDASRSMDNGRMGAVNNALEELKFKLTEIKTDNNLDMRVAVMSFTSSAYWEIELTPVDELKFNGIKTRAGLTQYGSVFHELNKVLTKDKFMKHSGKIAPPAIMFLTDGEPDDDYTYELDVLLKNGWFVNASRSAVLIGDAIYNDSAKRAVARFVNDEDTDIVGAEDSTIIMQKIQLATMHTIMGNPMDDGQGNDSPSVSDDKQNGNGNPFDPINPGDIDGAWGCDDGDIFKGKDPFNDTNDTDDPFGTANGTSGADDPFGTANGTSGADDPFGTANGTSGADDPFGTANGTSGTDDPFGTTNGTSGTDDPFGTADGTSDTDDPFGTAGGTGDMGDPFGVGGNSISGNPFDN